MVRGSAKDKNLYNHLCTCKYAKNYIHMHSAEVQVSTDNWNNTFLANSVTPHTHMLSNLEALHQLCTARRLPVILTDGCMADCGRQQALSLYSTERYMNTKTTPSLFGWSFTHCQEQRAARYTERVWSNVTSCFAMFTLVPCCIQINYGQPASCSLGQDTVFLVASPDPDRTWIRGITDIMSFGSTSNPPTCPIEEILAQWSCTCGLLAE